MKKILGLLALGLALMAPSAFADTLVSVPHPTAIWDATTATLYGLGIPGQGQSGLTIIPSAGVATTWTAPQVFSGGLSIPGGITGPTPVACGTTCTLTSANAGRTTLLNSAAGSVATLPAATGTGNAYPFVVTTAVSSNKDAILAASVADGMIGIAIGENANTAKAFVGASTFHSLQMPFAGTQPSGGFLGDNFVCRDISANVWQCNGTYQGGVTPTTPFNAATS